MLALRLASVLLFLTYFRSIASSPLKTRGLGSRLLRGVKATLFSGAGTFYEVGSGSCGEYDTDDMLVVAVNKAQMQNGMYFLLNVCEILMIYMKLGANPNNNPLCQNTVFITGNRGSTTARVVDTCPACPPGNFLRFLFPRIISFLNTAFINMIGALDMSPKGKGESVIMK